MFKQMNRFLKGSALVGAVAGITALSFAGIAVQMGHSNFKQKAEKQLHILNLAYRRSKCESEMVGPLGFEPRTKGL